MEIFGISNLLMNSLLVNDLVAKPPQAGNISYYNKTVSESLVADTGDYADISDEAYKLTILEGIKVPQVDTSSYKNDFNNMIVDYLNKDIS